MSLASDLRFHHVGVAVTDIDSARVFYEEVLAYSPLGPVIDDPVQRVRVCFLSRDDPPEPLLELVEPAGDDSPLKSILRRGGGGYHVCYTVDRLEEAIEAARQGGALPLGPPAPAVAFGGRRIAWLHSPARQLIELAERGAEPAAPARD